MENVVGEVFSEIEELLCKDVDNPMQIVHSWIPQYSYVLLPY